MERAGANDGFVSAWTDLRKEQGPHLFDFGFFIPHPKTYLDKN